MVSSEATPFSKTGGLADVSSSLSTALAKLGHDVHVILPRYGITSKPENTIKGRSFDVEFPDGNQFVTCFDTMLDLVHVHLIEHPWYSEREGIYGQTSFSPYMDNALRFSLLNKAALIWCKEHHWKPDVIHCHDWATALVPYLLKHERSTFFSDTLSVFTVHNLAYQGEFPRLDLLLLGIGAHEKFFMGDGIEKRFNMMKTGLEWADVITTVSKTYAKEIQQEQMGCNLDGLLRSRSHHVFGILNGIDTAQWNPSTDQFLPVHFSAEDLSGKQEIKRRVQKRFGLPIDDKVALIGIISRLAQQKGFDELLFGQMNALEHILETFSTQVIIVGTGDRQYETMLKKMATKHLNLSVNMIFSDEAAHLVEAGSDFFLMPSRYEPCGLNQMYSLAYGTIPIVRKTGGLADSVIDIDHNEEAGNGIVFEEMSSDAIVNAVTRAMKLFLEEPETLLEMRKRGMKVDFSWNHSAQEYVKIYEGLKKR